MLFDTIQDMLDQLRRKLHEPFPSRFSDTTLHKFISEAIEEISPQLGMIGGVVPLTIASGTPLIDIASLDPLIWAYAAQVVSDEESTPLLFHSGAYVVDNYPTIGTPAAPVGRPRIATIVGAGGDPGIGGVRQLALYPTPDANYSLLIYFIKMPQEAGLDQEPDLPADARRIAVDLAHCYALEALGRTQEAELKRRRLDRAIADVAYRWRTQARTYDDMLDVAWWEKRIVI